MIIKTEIRTCTAYFRAGSEKTQQLTEHKGQEGEIRRLPDFKPRRSEGSTEIRNTGR